MSPEYALNGIVSTRMDVFSFGVLMLEIISGKRNSSNFDSDHPINLIGYVSSISSCQMSCVCTNYDQVLTIPCYLDIFRHGRCGIRVKL